MPESLAGALAADADLGTAALATIAAVGALMAVLAAAGGRLLAAVAKRLAILAVAVGIGAAGYLGLRDGEGAALLGDFAARVAPPAAEAPVAPARERPRIGAGPREVVAYMERGAFALAGRANGVPLDFVFDTGATAVVLTADDAARIGWPASRLDYSVRVSTANGVTQAAPIIVERLAVGGIEVRDVRALVARPGDLGENLLGMTFLSRLASYEVTSDRLVLRGR